MLMVILACLAASAPAAVRPLANVHATYAATASPDTITASPAPCTDTKYNLFGVHWTTGLRWSFKSSTTPSYLNAADVATVLKRGFGNITNERNDCGRTDRVSATQLYLGTTTHGIGVTKTGQCGVSDGFNTVGFGQIPAGALALTCVRSIGARIVEIDIKLTNQEPWALTLASCSNDWMLESVITHEAGHAYGLDHVSETKHGRLTMSTFIDGTCENQESTLGLGDMKGLEAMY
jgi:hypothetical protein